jgi:WD40 repeat protein
MPDSDRVHPDSRVTRVFLQGQTPEGRFHCFSPGCQRALTANGYPEPTEKDRHYGGPEQHHGFVYLLLWDVATGECLRHYDGSTENGRELEYLGEQAGYSPSLVHDDWIAHHCELEGDTRDEYFRGAAEAACFSHDGRLVVSGHADGWIRQWNASTGHRIRTLPNGHPGGIACVAITTDGRWILSGGTGRTPGHGYEMRDSWVWVWDAVKGTLVRRLEGHRSHVEHLSVSPDGRRALSAEGLSLGVESERKARLWDVLSGDCIHELPHDDWLSFTGFSSDGKWLLTGDCSGVLRCWDAATGQYLHQIKFCSSRHASVRTALHIPGDQSILATCSGLSGNSVFLWKPATGQCRQVLSTQGAARIRAAALSPDGRKVLLGCDRQILALSLSV